LKKRLLAIGGAVATVGIALSLVTNGLIARAGDQNHFEIFFKNDDTRVIMGRYSFEVSDWEFGDRAGYRCAWAFLLDGGVPVARVQFDRGQTYTQIIDKYGDETENDASECLPKEELETKPKPPSLGDTIIGFNNGSTTIESLTFPATSPEDPDSWWEFEEAEDDHVEVELYWKDDVAVIATITSLSPSLSFSARSTAPPTLTSFSPAVGGPGTQVTITGANYVGVTSVTFNGTAATFEAHSAGEIVATVPTGATAGPIAVTTSLGTATSANSFTITGGVAHATSVTLKLSGRLVAKGTVEVSDGTAECVAGRVVVVERKVSGQWKSKGSDQTGDAGFYREKVKNKSGTYRARVKKSTLPNGDVCLRALSAKRFN
jgi:hypothetical protein